MFHQNFPKGYIIFLGICDVFFSNVQAAKYNARDAVEYLLSLDGDYKAKDKYGWTPLHWVRMNALFCTGYISCTQSSVLFHVPHIGTVLKKIVERCFSCIVFQTLLLT